MAAGDIVIQVIEPTEVMALDRRLRSMMAKFVKAIEEERDIQKRQLGLFTGTWSQPSKPDWSRPPIRVTAQRISGDLSTNSRIFRFVELGTEIRYATMTSDFVAKTKIGRVRSGPGRGGKLYVSRLRPRKGIRKRSVVPLIAKRREPRFQAKIMKIVANEISRHSSR